MKISINIAVVLVTLVQVTQGMLQLSGKLTDVPKSYQLIDKNDYVNGENFGIRCSIELNSLEDSSKIQLPVKKNFQFNSRPLKPGKYDLTINSHDFTFLQDRFIIDVNESTILATDYYLDKKELGEPKDITNEPLLVKTISTRQYYEVRLNSLGDMIKNSPLGFIFKNKIYTMIFLFSIVMMVGPYLLKFFNPEMAKRLEELKQEQSKQGTIFIDPKEIKDSKVEEISRETPPGNNARRRKH